MGLGYLDSRREADEIKMRYLKYSGSKQWGQTGIVNVTSDPIQPHIHPGLKLKFFIQALMVPGIPD